MDVDGRVQFRNPAVERILGAAAAEPRHCWEVFAGSDPDGSRLCYPGCDVVKRARQGEPVPHFEMVSAGGPGAPVRLDVSTLALPGPRRDRPVIVHLFREIPGSLDTEARGREPAAAPPDPAAAPSGRSGPLTVREAEILRLIAGGAGTRVVAARLGISPATVRNHVRNIFGKLGVNSRLQAAAYAIRAGLAGGEGPPASLR
jgi:DNA-binding CsgD family transcriptional regulator